MEFNGTFELEDATVVAEGPDGEREIPVDDYFFGMYATDLAHDEVLTRVEIPSATDAVGAYAKKLLEPGGDGVGSITAGCLEDEVRDLAAGVLADGEPRVETWDLTGDADVWGMGVGCNGIISVLLEPLGESYRPVTTARERGEDVGVVTVVGGDLPVGTRGVYRPESGVTDGDLPAWVTEAADQLVATGVGETLTVDAAEGTVDAFVDGVRVPPELVVSGSGHDVAPVVELAKLVDFEVTVVSFRGGQAGADRFPRADAVVSASPRDVGDLREWGGDTYAVVMTHNFVDDRLVMDQLLGTPIPYVGLMGPSERFDEIREALAEDGRPLTDAEYDRIYTPVGLRLGGDTPYQIAYSIVAELLVVSRDETPEHLSRLAGSIHDRTEISTE